MRRYGCYAAQLERTTLVFWICSSRLTKFFFLAQFSPYPTQIIHRNVGIFVRIQKMWLIIVGITDFCQMASKQHSLQTPHSQSQSLWRDEFSNGHKWCHVQTEPNISPDSPAHDSVMSLIPFTIICVCFRVPICLWKTPDTLTQRSKETRWRLHSSVGSLGLSHFSLFIFNKYDDTDYSKSFTFGKEMFIIYLHKARATCESEAALHISYCCDSGWHGGAWV